MEPIKELLPIIKDSLKKLGDDHRLLLDTIDKRYSEENKSQILIITGAFALLVNFLINQKNLEYIPVLLIAVTLFVLNIILKFHILRLSAERALDELKIVREKINVSGKLYALLVKLSLTGDRGVMKEIEKENGSLCRLDFDLDALPKKWSNSKILNEIEFYLFSVGLGLVLIFFYINV